MVLDVIIAIAMLEVLTYNQENFLFAIKRVDNVDVDPE